MPVNHSFTSPQVDDNDPNEVGPDDWNDDHVGWPPIINTINILTPTTLAEPTFNINSLTYVDQSYLSFYTDFDVIPWTHFRIFGFGRGNAAGTVTFQACHSGTNALSATGNDATVGSSNAVIDSGWKAITASLTGHQRLSVLLKGSTSTLDFTYQKLGIELKYDP